MKHITLITRSREHLKLAPLPADTDMQQWEAQNKTILEKIGVEEILVREEKAVAA